MWKRIALVAAWVVATLATAAITLAAVSQAGHEVSERPAVPVSAEDLAASVAGGSTSSTLESAVPTAGATSTTTTTAGSSTTASSSTVAAGGSSTTSGSTVVAVFTESRTTPGGTVTVAVSGSTLTLSSAIPAQGFDADIESNGSTEVEVKFEKHDDPVEYRVKARLEDGEIRWEIRTEVDGD